MCNSQRQTGAAHARTHDCIGHRVQKARTRGEQAVDVDVLLLPVAPHTRSCLLVCGRVPVGVKEHEAVGANEVETATAGLAAEQEDKAPLPRIIEGLHLHSPPSHVPFYTSSDCSKAAGKAAQRAALFASRAVAGRCLLVVPKCGM